jgi:hypothetical protein
MRIAHDEIPDALFDETQQDMYTQDDIPMTQFGYNGSA